MDLERLNNVLFYFLLLFVSSIGKCTETYLNQEY